MITISIDATRLDKSRFKHITRKNGEKAIFIELVLLETKSEFGDYLVKQSSTKEEREAKVEMPILGNGKIVGKKTSEQSVDEPPRVSHKPIKLAQDWSEAADIPF